MEGRLEANVYPAIGRKAINSITPTDLVGMLRKIEERGAVYTGKRVHQLVGSVFRMAVAEGHIATDPSAHIGDALAPTPAPRHRASASAWDLPEIMKAICTYSGDPITRLGLRMIVHTFVRTKELRFAAWGEFHDLEGDGPTWRIPGERMKMRRDHIVPLTPQMLNILADLRAINGDSRYVFRSPTARFDKPMSENTLIFALYRLGYHSRLTVHGFRSTASTILNENDFNRDWIELQLAHVDVSVRGIYNSALYLNQRRKMMEWWSEYLEPSITVRPRQVKEQFDDIL